MQSVLNINITMCERSNKPDTCKPGNLLTVLQTDKYKALAEQCSRIKDKKERQAFKLANVPVITVSGLFSYRDDKHLLWHSCLLCIDLDGVQDIQALKEKVTALPFVAYCGRSISGTGLYVIVVIPKSTPEEHKRRYATLENYFIRTFGITGTVDPQPKNVAACRYVSYDPEGYFNHNAALYNGIANDVPVKPILLRMPYKQPFNGTNDYDKVFEMAEKIQARHLDFCPDYADYLKVSFSLAVGLGESGRDVFHSVCQFSNKYNYKDADTKYSEALKHGSKTTLGTFFGMCKDYGLMADKKQWTEIPVYVPAPARVQNDYTPVNDVPVKPESTLPEPTPGPDNSRWIMLNNLLNEGFAITKLYAARGITDEINRRNKQLSDTLIANGLLANYRKAGN